MPRGSGDPWEVATADVPNDSINVQRDANQETSIILGLGIQSAIDLGASVDSVREDLVYLVNEFPGTQGAELAGRLLTKSSIQY